MRDTESGTTRPTDVQPSASDRHTWWGVTAPRRAVVPRQWTWTGVLVVAAVVATFPLALWLATEPLVAVALLSVALTALATRRLGRPFVGRPERGPPHLPVVAPRDR